MFETKGNFTTIILGVLLIILVFFIFMYALQPTTDRVEWRQETYIVKSGDSLWSISNKFCPDNVDQREWIAEVKQINGLEDSNIYPGQRLVVLAPVE